MNPGDTVGWRMPDALDEPVVCADCFAAGAPVHGGLASAIRREAADAVAACSSCDARLRDVDIEEGDVARC